MNRATRILVVDDEPTVLDLFSHILRDSNYEVWTATTGRGGLRAARERRPDVVLLDVMLPDVSGIKVCHELKQDANLPDVFVALCSAAAISSMSPSTATSSKRGSDIPGNRTATRTNAAATSTPTPPPAAASIRFSTRICLASRTRPQPRLERIANSARRVTVLAMSRLETLTQQMSNKQAAAPDSTGNVDFAEATTQPWT